MKSKINDAFAERFGNKGEWYASAGRINLIGEHTDYNGSFVFPGAIDKGIMARINKNGTQRIRAYAVDLNEYAEFGLNEEDVPEMHWAKYIFGVCREIEKRGGKIGGFDTVFAGNVPLGAGMSSSAALESTYAFALNEMFSLGFDKFELARIGQATEHNYCGVMCGIMDQFASVFGKADNLMLLDCRSLEYKYYPFDTKEYRLVLVDSVVKHQLVGSPYNRRRESCERAAQAMGVELLRDATMQKLDEVRGVLTDEDYRRAKYIIEETERVKVVCDALVCGDYQTVGKMLYLAHEGMSKDFEISCEELDYLNDIAKECGVTGSRMMGGGFGGCTINLVANGLYDSFIATVSKKFDAKYGHRPKIYDVVISDGARRLE